MRIFTAKLRQLIGTCRNPVSLAPRDVLFEAQRHFLERLFDRIGVARRRADVEVPHDGGPILFRCGVSLRESPYAVICGIANADWGAFEVKGIRISESSPTDPSWINVTFVVDVRGAREDAGGQADGKKNAETRKEVP